MNFDTRADLSEWMDEPCSYEDLRKCLSDLEQVNRFTFAYGPTLRWLQAATRGAQRPLHIVDVGSGGGDTLRTIAAWARAEDIDLRLTGIDLNPHATRAAAGFTPVEPLIEWRTGDAFSYDPELPIDFVISSLFTHHLPDREIVAFLQWMERVAVRGWFINDLHRGRLPYIAFGVMAKAMRWHRFIQHDGPVSVRRAFQEKDWYAYLDQAEIAREKVTVEACWPSRLCVSRVKP